MRRFYIYIFLILISFSSNIYPGAIDLKNIRIPANADLLFYNGVQVKNGGFGSALAVDPDDSTIFYILTDRGPCVNSSDYPNTKIFVVPGFTPQIGKFKLENDSLRLLDVIELRDRNGNNLTGLPNRSSGEDEDTLLLDITYNKLKTDSLGIDPEGLVMLKDKSFWVSDEYGPGLIHFDADGKIIKRIIPDISLGALPQVFSRREPNGGMEGLTITPDGKTLVGIMQSPLFNPTKDYVKDSKVTRLLTYNLESGLTKQYVYLLEETNTNLSDIEAISDSTFLVLERDGDYLYGSPVSLYKSVYKININGATDISDPSNSTYGKLIKSKTIEMLENKSTLLSKGITPVKKTLIVNLVNNNYSHDKPEGLAILDNKTIAICNDDDFGIESNKRTIISAKKIPTGIDKVVDYNELTIVQLDQSLIDAPTSVRDNITGSPIEFGLDQNYPNPFNPATNIGYRISNIGFVSLRIFDVLGREVTVLVNEVKLPGVYTVSFDGSSLTSGVYFYQIRTKNFISTKKMIIAK